MKKRIMIIAAVILAAVVFTGFAAVRIIEGNLDRLQTVFRQPMPQNPAYP